MKKRALIWLLAILLVIIGSVVGTLAFLTDIDTKTNTMTIGNVAIELLEYERTSVDDKNAANVRVFKQDKPLYPAVVEDDFSYSGLDYSNPTAKAYVDWTSIGKNDYQTPIWDPALINNEIDKMVFVKNTGDNDAYVRVFYAFEVGAYTNFKQFEEKVHLNKNAKEWTWEWKDHIYKTEKSNEKFFIAVATYNKTLIPGAITEISLSQISLDPIGSNEDIRGFRQKYDVHVFAQAIQTQSFSDNVTALSTGFGGDIPFEMKIYEGDSLKTVLHYFEGDTSNAEKITSKVLSVTFGTKEQYPDIVNDKTLEPTLTVNGYNTANGMEYGALTHTYYVPDGDSGNYHLYVLADEGKIYAPKSCSHLFEDMYNLTSVKGEIFDVSHTTEMASMFADCKKLQNVETSKWVVDNVTNMDSTFSSCNALVELDVSGWNVSKVTTMRGLFDGCGVLGKLEVSDWKVNEVTNAERVFKSCAALKTLEVGGWRLPKATTTSEMFSGCTNLESLDVSQWGVSANNTSISLMFAGCENLTSLDLSGWDVSGVTTMSQTFYGCSGLTELKLVKDGSEKGWDVAKVKDFYRTFAGCESLTKLSVENWDVSSATTMQNMFSDCKKLTSLDLSAWGDKVKGVTTMSRMFRNCSSLTLLDVSTWDVRAVTTMFEMFQNCSALTSLDVSRWTVNNLTNARTMFSGCSGLTVLDLSAWNTKNLENTYQMFNYCVNLKTIWVGGDWTVAKVTSSVEMFNNCTSLVGGGSNQKTYNSKDYLDATYANYTDGYLTYKAADSTNS